MTNYTDAMIKKYGSKKAWLVYLHEIASKGGSRKVPKGFATMDKELANKLRLKGGYNSHKRTK